ncbi:hypothetical protein CEUSTIGMA_g1728.t1 [Chlamydomonas eustigma]|uniref:DNA polymerase alpha subunit B n=1 Tax=Chlamydomonas eustigma TaxID=1157962 RepID=A0A250WU74_9CHLO|nr:hypothetical protein CEUSTIGMA_g1728.t1 [Chlamydomonas eustigma]|eukprot:GAX74279.1 hypothetical protein CEUSTIGMA_g1728.t1 [Chlamydomonas eustigma]
MDVLIKAFKSGNFSFDDQSVVKNCQDLAEKFRLSSEEIATQYDNYFSTLDSLGYKITAGSLASFSRFLEKEVAASERQKNTSAVKPRVFAKAYDDTHDQPTPPNKRHAGSAAKSGLLTPGGIAPSNLTPMTGRSQLTATPASASTAFRARTNRGQTVCIFNEEIRSQWNKTASSGTSVQILGEPLTLPGVQHLHMMDTLEGKVQCINDRIVDYGEAMKRALPEAKDICRTSVSEVTQEPVWVAGRIVAEHEAAGSALNAQSVLLEGSREASGGARVRLDLSQLQSFRLFPGQVVGVKGLNPTGSTFVAQQLITHVIPVGRMMEEKKGEGTAAASPPKHLSMVVAAGPFTNSDNVLYEPLTDLLQYCSEHDVDQVLLMGPFVDVEHPRIKDGTLDVLFEQLFQQQVLSKLHEWQQLSENKKRHVLLMPSTRDAHSHPVFPQPPFMLPSDSNKVRSIQSPTCFVSEGLTVAACSQDVLLHLSAGEIAHGQGQDRMGALASHVIGQQSFYPVFPPPLGTCLDTSHYSALQLQTTPDILFCPPPLLLFRN